MKIVIAEAFENLSDFIRNLPQGSHPVDEVIRDHRNILTKVTLEGKTYVIKQYVRPRFYNRIAYTFLRKSKARRSYEYAFELFRRGIGTANPVAYIEIKKGGLFYTGYFVSEFLDQPLLTTLEEYPERLQVLEDFVDFTVRLHQQGIIHRDYNPLNILYRKEAGNYRFSIIDINRMNFRKKLSKRQCLNSMKRLGFDYPLLAQYVSRYAQKRGWYPEYTLGKFFTLREKFLKPRRKKMQKTVSNKSS
ncbi:MAG: lipopolysaccharide kinase InaA family protein [Rikenellaceae bacterium]|nr:lipopolysaccharide kinase InaA family protein [Rikenellaceae bacterium]